jgi:hypothetical protein
MGTLKTQKQLETLLGDNTTKAISAEDVRTIVTSNYQPQMIYSAYTFENAGTSLNEHKFRIMYYNPSYFSDSSITTATDNGAVWRVNNVGSGLATGTYTNQELLPPDTYRGFGGTGTSWDTVGGVTKPAVFNFEVLGGQITNVELVSPGIGWMGRDFARAANNMVDEGMVGSFNLAGISAANQPKLEFMGAIRQYYEDDDRTIGTMSTNPTLQGSNSDHNGMNTLILTSTAQQTDGDAQGYLTNANELTISTDLRRVYFSLCRMPQFA